MVACLLLAAIGSSIGHLYSGLRLSRVDTSSNGFDGKTTSREAVSGYCCGNGIEVVIGEVETEIFHL